jgi:hypothetical protein
MEIMKMKRKKKWKKNENTAKEEVEHKEDRK